MFRNGIRLLPGATAFRNHRRRQLAESDGWARFQITDIGRIKGALTNVVAFEVLGEAALFVGRERALAFGVGVGAQDVFVGGDEEAGGAAGGVEDGAERVQVGGIDFDTGFKANVGGRIALLEKPPASRFEQLVDLDAGGGFFIGHSGCCSWDGRQAA
jgi:hypothetical protein